MTEVKTRADQPSSMAERADTTVKTGDGPQRTFHNLHSSGSSKRHGEINKGEGNINNEPYQDRRRED